MAHPIYFLTRSSGYRVGLIAKGIIEACQTFNLPMHWQDLDNLKEINPQKVHSFLFWGKLDDYETLKNYVGGRVPIISTIGHTLEMPVPTVIPDTEFIGQTVAQHFLDQNLKHFVYVGSSKNPASRWRGEAFEASIGKYIKKPNFKFISCDIEDRFWGADSVRGKAFIRFLKKSPKPIGILAFSDQVAVSCLSCILATNLRVPQDIAIVGVDDHPLYTRMFKSLSSVQIEYETIGVKAVELAIAFKSASKDPPSLWERRSARGKLVARESSQLKLLGDPKIAKVIAIIESRYNEPLDLVSLAQEVGMSRASFAAHFKNRVGISPINFLIQTRLEKSTDLLRTSAETISEISRKVGFSDQGYFTRTFHKHYGSSPSEFRKKK